MTPYLVAISAVATNVTVSTLTHNNTAACTAAAAVFFGLWAICHTIKNEK